MTWRWYLSARSTRTLIAAWCATFVIVMVTAPAVIVVPVQLMWNQPTRWTPLWELLPALLAAGSGALVAPAAVTLERLGRPSLRLRAGVVAAFTVTAPALIPVAAHLVLPADARWLDIATNVATIGASSLLLVALAGRVLGALVASALYLGLVLLQHAAPGISLGIPFSGMLGNLRPHGMATALLALAAVTCWSLTLGQSRFAAALQRNEG